jgi:Zn-dependent protease with chaperone function
LKEQAVDESPQSEPSPASDEHARLRAEQRHEALAAGLLALPNLMFRSTLTLVVLYGILTLVLISAVEFGGLRPEAALVAGVGFALLQFLFGPWILGLVLRILYTMRWVRPEDLPEHLRTFVQRVCEEERLKFPSFGIIEDGAPQAFTYGHHPNNARIVISRGLMNLLEPDELEAVVAHEIGHARNWDMVLMTLANLVPLLLYYIYSAARRMAIRQRGSDRKGKQGVILLQIGAYLLYIVSQYIVLWFSRTREYYADRFAGQATGNPNALASALVKIAYGLAAQQITPDTSAEEEHGEQKKPPRRNRSVGGVGALGALNIFDRSAAVNLVMCSAQQGTLPRNLDLERVKSAMQWDLWNPWAWWFELNSTHPLIAKRLRYLGDQAAALKQEPLVVFDRAQPESYWDEFLVDLGVMVLPLLGLLAGGGLALAFALQTGVWQMHWIGVAVALFGLGLLIKTRVKYRGKTYPPATVAALMGHVEVSPVRPVPATVTGKIIGKGVPGLIFSDDFVLQDETGILFLDYQQPLAIWNFLFGLLRAGEYQGADVTVRGWFRRAPVPYLEIYRLEPADGSLSARTCYSYHVSLFFSGLICLAGVVLAGYWLIAS